MGIPQISSIVVICISIYIHIKENDQFVSVVCVSIAKGDIRIVQMKNVSNKNVPIGRLYLIELWPRLLCLFNYSSLTATDSIRAQKRRILNAAQKHFDFDERCL